VNNAGRTLLSADVGLALGTVKIKIKIRIRINGKVNGGGQECPPYTDSRFGKILVNMAKLHDWA